MYLKNLIDWLEKQEPTSVIPHGFGTPVSFDNELTNLVFSPEKNALVSDMLKYAKMAREEDEYFCKEFTRCYIGVCTASDMIGETMIKLWEYCIKVENLAKLARKLSD